MSEQQIPKVDIKIDKNGFYRDEAFTDLQAASIRRISPVKPDGTPDDSRESRFIGHTQIMTQEGPLPLQCTIPAKTLEEAMEKFPDAINSVLVDLIKKAEEMKKQQESRIVVPGQDPGQGGPKIQMP